MRPCVLLGYASGGWMANAVAPCLERQVHAPEAVVLLDTHTATASFQTRLEGALRRRAAAGDVRSVDSRAVAEIRATGPFDVALRGIRTHT